MPTVLDSFLVEIGLDPQKFIKGQKEAESSFKKTKDESNRMAKDMEESGKKAAQFFVRLRNEALALFAAFKLGQGITEFVQSIVGGDAALGRMSQQLGVSAQELGKWQNAVEIVGGNAGEATQAMASLTSQLEQYRLNGQMSEALQVFQRLGINIHDSNGNLKTATQLFGEFNAKIQGLLRTDPRKARELLRMITPSQGMANVLLQTTGAYQNLMRAAQQNVPTDTQIKQAQQMQQTWHQLDLALTQIGRTIVNDFGPAVLKAISSMEGWIDKNHQWLESNIKEAIQTFIGVLRQIPWSAVAAGAHAAFDTVINLIKAIPWQQLGKAAGDALRQLTQILKDIPWDQVRAAADSFGHALYNVHKAINSLLGDKGELELFMGLWVGAKFAGMIGGIAKLVVALAPLAAALGPIGLAAAALGALVMTMPQSQPPPGQQPTTGMEHTLVGNLRPWAEDKFNSVMGWVRSVLPQTGSAQQQAGNPAGGPVMNDNSRSASTQINGPIIIQTMATDAAAIARTLADAIKQRGLATQGNSGPN